MKKHLTTLVLMAVFALVTLVVLGCGRRTDQERLDLAVTSMQADLPEVGRMLAEVQSQTRLAILPGSIEGEALATTSVSVDGITIQVDLAKAEAKREHLEPILAHELIHAHDALFVYGLPAFRAIGEQDAGLPWAQRRLEKSAIQQENALRSELRRRNPVKYRDMPARRA
jgi:hypothetical protein